MSDCLRIGCVALALIASAHVAASKNCSPDGIERGGEGVRQACDYALQALIPHIDSTRLDLFQRIIDDFDLKAGSAKRRASYRYIETRLDAILYHTSYVEELEEHYREGFDALTHRIMDSVDARRDWYGKLFAAYVEINQGFRAGRWQNSQEARAVIDRILQDKSEFRIPGTGVISSDYFGNNTKMFFSALTVDVWEWGLHKALNNMREDFRIVVNAYVDGIGGLAMWIVGLAFAVAAFSLGWRAIFHGSLDIEAALKLLAQLVIMTALTLWLLSPVEVSPADPDRAGAQAEYDYAQGSEVSTRFMAWTSGLAVLLEHQATKAFCESVSSRPVTESRRDLISALCERGEEVNPGNIFAYGIQRAMRLLSIPVNHMATLEADLSWHPGKLAEGVSHYTLAMMMCLSMLAMGVVAGFAVVVMYLFISLLLIFLWVEGYMICAFGLVVLALFPNDWTKDKALSYVWYAIGWAVRMAMIMLIYMVVDGVLVGTLAGAGLTIQGEFARPNIGSYFLFCVFEIIAPLVIIWMVYSTTSKIAEFLGSSGSIIGDQVSSTASRIAGNTLVSIAQMAAAGTVAGASGVGNAAMSGVGKAAPGAAEAAKAAGGMGAGKTAKAAGFMTEAKKARSGEIDDVMRDFISRKPKPQ